MEEVEILKIVPHVLGSMQKKIWIDYDEEADVLYINFTYPPNAVEHEEDEQGIIKNYDEHGNLTGITIISAKRLKNTQTWQNKQSR
jgi:uncharacterized protein YuzE